VLGLKEILKDFHRWEKANLCAKNGEIPEQIPNYLDVAG